MSQMNVEIVWRYLEESFPESVPLEQNLARITECWESDSDYYPVRKFPEATPCHGRREIAGFLTDYLNAWKTYRYGIVDAWAIGDDRVLAQGHASAEGRVSGVALEGDLYTCFWLRHGRFIRVEDHLTLKGALHAFGLSGETLEAAGLRG